MNFPPLDDPRWDLLLGVVTGQRPTVQDPDSPLAASFPALLSQEQAMQDEPEPWQHTVDLDAYA